MIKESKLKHLKIFPWSFFKPNSNQIHTIFYTYELLFTDLHDSDTFGSPKRHFNNDLLKIQTQYFNLSITTWRKFQSINKQNITLLKFALEYYQHMGFRNRKKIIKTHHFFLFLKKHHPVFRQNLLDLSKLIILSRNRKGNIHCPIYSNWDWEKNMIRKKLEPLSLYWSFQKKYCWDPVSNYYAWFWPKWWRLGKHRNSLLIKELNHSSSNKCKSFHVSQSWKKTTLQQATRKLISLNDFDALQSEADCSFNHSSVS